MLGEMPTSNRKPDDLVKTECAYSTTAPAVPPRTDEMMIIPKNSLSSPASSPTTVKTDLSSTSSDQLSDEPTSTSVSGGPLYDEIHLRENGTGVPDEFDPTGPLLTPPTTLLLSSRSKNYMKSDTCTSAGSPLYSEPAPAVPPRTDEMMVLSEESSSLPDSRPKIDLLSTPSSDQLGDKLSSAHVSVGPLYDEPLLTKLVVVQSQPNGDQTAPRGVSNGPNYAQTVLPTSSQNTVSAPPTTDEAGKCLNPQVSKMAGVHVIHINLTPNAPHPLHGQQYAILGEMPTSKGKPDDLVKTEHEYSEIQPQPFRSVAVPSPDVTSVKLDISSEECSATKGSIYYRRTTKDCVLNIMCTVIDRPFS